MHKDEDLIDDVMSLFRGQGNCYEKFEDELPYDYEENKEHIRNEKLRLSKQKAKPVAKPFVRRIRKRQVR